MEFTYTQKREHYSYAQQSVAMGRRGMVASSQRLATLAGYKVLARGGKAVDAAVAMVSVLNVVEPQSVGIGGDAFALLYLADEDRIVGMNASGRAPVKATLEWFHERGIMDMPERGMLPVTVPGALHGWAEASRLYGNQALSTLFEDAIHYAEYGFPVTEVIAGDWKYSEDLLLSRRDSANAYLINGKAPVPGQVFRNPDLAKTLKKIAEGGPDAFYKGEIAQTIVDFSNRNDGLFSLEDFESHTTTWVEPISTDYRGYTVYELPPNGQGLAALEMLNILEGYDVAGMGHNSPDYLHTLIEAKKAAFADRDWFITDPEFEDIPVERLKSKEYAEECRKRIDPFKAKSPGSPATAKPSETVYVTAVDEKGNAASFISSIYMHYGSGVVADGTGIVLQNRGHSFSLNPKHPNHIEPKKRPMHTIIPGMVFENGKLLMSFGVMGGDMQPQGHTQFLTNVIDFKMNLQEAMDAPRARHIADMTVYVEDGVNDRTKAILESKGHAILGGPRPINEVGGGQVVYVDRAQGVLLGASDKRKDGCAIGY